MKTPQPGRGKRLAASAAFGAAVALALIAWDDLHHHASLVAATTASEPKGVHLTVGFILATGGIFTFLVVTLAAFVVVTILGRLRGGRRQAPARSAVMPYAVPAKRGR